MNALILDGSKNTDTTLQVARRVMEEELTRMGWGVRSFTLRDVKIASCIGCFGCWIKTPGICVINDSGRDITHLAAVSDLWIFLTPVTFGGYSSDLKKAVDRILPIFVPIFTKYKNETHHKWRPTIRPNFIVLGGESSLAGETKGLFETMVMRNAINFHSPLWRHLFLAKLLTSTEIRNEIKSVFDDMKINMHG